MRMLIAKLRNVTRWFQSNLTNRKVQEGNDQEKVQSERNSHSKNEAGKTKSTIRYLYLESISQAE